MADWKYQLDLSDLRRKYDAGKLTVNELGRAISERLKNQYWFKEHKEYLGGVVRRLERVTTVEGFDRVLEDLYDWGDSEWGEPEGCMAKRLCWIGMV